jgi:hypothetical protein
MKLAKKVSSGALIVLLALALVTPVEAETRTGQYIGDGVTLQVRTGFTTIQSLRIVSVPARGPSAIGYTTDVFQGAGQGTFLNGNKRDSGIALERGNFTVANEDFHEVGVLYAWEANGE